MVTTVDVEDLTNLGTITTGDKLVAERVAGATRLVNYAVDVTLDTAPVLGGDLGVGSYSFVDVNLNELFKFNAAASAVNEFTVNNAAIGNNPVLEASGGDTNISAVIKSKGTGSGIIQSASTTAPLIIQSGTSYQHTTTIAPANTAASRTVTLPDADGTMAYSALAYGGTNAALTADNGAIVYSTASALALLASTATAGKLLRSGSSAAPTWSTPTYPNAATSGTVIRGDGTNFVVSTSTFADTYTTSNLLYASSSNTVAGLATANSGILVTNGSGVPSIGTDIPTAVTLGGAYIYRASGTDVPVADGGTGVSTLATYAIVCGGTTTTGAVQQVSGNGTSQQILMAGGNGVLPFWSTPTFPNAVSTAGKHIKSDGSNFVTTTTTMPDTGTSRKMIVGDGTNYVESTETWAVPSTSGKIMQSDGTNWTSVTPQGTGTPVCATSPTLTTPNIGVATGTSFNSLTGAATQAEQETGSSITAVTTPGRQHYHPSAAKMWLVCGLTGTINASYNVTSITDTGTGILTITIATDFADANYSIAGVVSGGSTVVRTMMHNSVAAGSLVMNTTDGGGTLADPAGPNTWCVSAYGDQA